MIVLIGLSDEYLCLHHYKTYSMEQWLKFYPNFPGKKKPIIHNKHSTNVLDEFTNPRCYHIPNILYLLSNGRILGFELKDVKLLYVCTGRFRHLRNSRKDLHMPSSISAKIPGSSSSLCRIPKLLATAVRLHPPPLRFVPVGRVSALWLTETGSTQHFAALILFSFWLLSSPGEQKMLCGTRRGKKKMCGTRRNANEIQKRTVKRKKSL